MIMQVAAWQARWEAKTACFCLPCHADQDHGTYPVATTVAKDKVTRVIWHVDPGNEPTTSSFATTDLTGRYRNVCALAAQGAGSHLPSWVISSISHSRLWWLRLCNHLMSCCAAVSFPKSVTVFLQDLSNFMLKCSNDLLWPNLSSGNILFAFLYLDSSEKFTLHSVHCFLTNFL